MGRNRTGNIRKVITTFLLAMVAVPSILILAVLGGGGFASWVLVGAAMCLFFSSLGILINHIG